MVKPRFALFSTGAKFYPDNFGRNQKNEESTIAWHGKMLRQ